MVHSLTRFEGKQTTRKKNGILTAFLISHGTVSLIKKAGRRTVGFTNKARMEKKNGILTQIKLFRANASKIIFFVSMPIFVRGRRKSPDIPNNEQKF
jgi:hypothetical protein